jgi:hypothetical protein
VLWTADVHVRLDVVVLVRCRDPWRGDAWDGVEWAMRLDVVVLVRCRDPWRGDAWDGVEWAMRLDVIALVRGGDARNGDAWGWVEWAMRLDVVLRLVVLAHIRDVPVALDLFVVPSLLWPVLILHRTASFRISKPMH